MQFAKGKLLAIGGAEDKGTDLETGQIHRNNLNFFFPVSCQKYF